ncbi:hypothetical protein JXA63_04045 [Candidatus Woesebacteria bacterium]|nr:hypothetical protein [Candidatus Woesebacteria bacterium]
MSKLSKPTGNRFLSKRILLILGLILVLIIILVGVEPRFHYHDGGGVCKVSGWAGLGIPAKRRICFCAGIVSPIRTGWFEGPSTYTCGGLGTSFISPLSVPGNISSKINKVVDCFSMIGSGSDYEVSSKCKFLF